MYKCKPERCVRQAVILIAGCAVICLTVGSFSSISPLYKWAYQAIFIIILSVAVFIAYRYTMTEMVYIVEGDSFTVTKTVGEKTTVACSLNLSTAKGLVDRNEFASNKKAFGYINKKLNFCQNINARYWCYICEFNGKTILVKFEPNEIFAAKMKESIEDNRSK